MHATKKFGLEGTGNGFSDKKLLNASATFSYLAEPNSHTLLTYDAVPLDSNTVGVRADIYFIPLDATSISTRFVTPAPATA
jgi:hypothetical protein